MSMWFWTFFLNFSLAMRSNAISENRDAEFPHGERNRFVCTFEKPVQKWVKLGLLRRREEKALRGEVGKRRKALRRRKSPDRKGGGKGRAREHYDGRGQNRDSSFKTWTAESFLHLKFSTRQHLKNTFRFRARNFSKILRPNSKKLKPVAGK